ncbi:hypothetical protein [Colwellia sp. E2M01]|uniref:hypothetical protein n=1 Tax=Colwellia sp. E2M01 TaxID=2841561 RepID=UPI001C09F028|nr:hypothetical protein [Colwellia sp. E2M01]MBU2871535.1 hypothetical protein [Colwellia sp. E2M01]
MKEYLTKDEDLMISFNVKNETVEFASGRIVFKVNINQLNVVEAVDRFVIMFHQNTKAPNLIVLNGLSEALEISDFLERPIWLLQSDGETLKLRGVNNAS